MKYVLAGLAVYLAATISLAGGHQQSYIRNDVTLLIEWDDEFTEEEQTKLLKWQDSVFDTVTLLNGSLPRPVIRVAFRGYRGSAAVPFARVIRQEPQGIEYYVNADRPLNEFISDWTAYHEMTHLFIPYPGMPDIWFSEGLASYYQNILQYRAGLLSADEARRKLRNGFERGRKDDRNSDLNLRELSKAMHKRRAYMRVYWSGALYFLEADLALRASPTESSTVTSLDEVLLRYSQCCLANSEQSGLQIAQTFDQIADRELFVPLYLQYQATTAIPDFTTILSTAEMDALLPAIAE